MKEIILEKLQEIEKENNIEILYACEAGSRSWGFSSNASDWDVRFIYKKACAADYLTLNNSRDIIEKVDRLFDFHGWDIKKALKLHYKNNPSLREWLLSNEVYIDRGIDNIFSGLGAFSKNILFNHYLAISKKHYRKYCSGQFNPKKYLHVIRYLLSAMALDEGKCPPINIHALIGEVEISHQLKTDIISMIDYQKGNAVISTQTIGRIDEFIKCSFKLLKANEIGENDKSPEKYDERFRELLFLSFRRD